MTTNAWIMFSLTCAIITYFTIYFFVKVLRIPPRDDDE